MNRIIFIFVFELLFVLPLNAADAINSDAAYQPDYSGYYRVQTLRAAPGALAELLQAMQQLHNDGYYRQTGLTVPWLIRHSQGDQWDLLLIQSVPDYSGYFQALQSAQAQQAKTQHAQALAVLEQQVAFADEFFMRGPAAGKLIAMLDNKPFAHIEVFHALAGKHAELLRQREMENTYMLGIDKQPNAIFSTDFGGDADIMTIGFYPSLQAFAQPPAQADAERSKIAQQAGFRDLDDIGLYLRRLISAHHDTLGNLVDFE